MNGESVRRRAEQSSPQLVSSCASNFNSTSIFIKLMLAFQGDRIQTLTRISPPRLNWYRHTQGTQCKKETHFNPPSPGSFLSCCCPVLPSLILSRSPSLASVSNLCSVHPPPLFFPLRVPPCQSTVWATLHILLQCDGQAPPGSDGVICLEKWTGIKKKKKKRQMTMSPNDCREREWQTERCVSR